MIFPGLKGTPEQSIATFLGEARKALKPYGTFLGASVFGVAATRPTEVAQDIPAIGRNVDYVAPMVYPSHWGNGEYNVAYPNAEPYEIVQRSLEGLHHAGARARAHASCRGCRTSRSASTTGRRRSRRRSRPRATTASTSGCSGTRP